MSKVERKRKTFNVRLTRFGLIHLRDILSVKMTPAMDTTLSQALAAAEDRSLIEANLWQSVVHACKEAGVPLGDEAPDYVVAAEPVMTRPPVGVFRLSTDPDESQAPPADSNSPFDFTEEQE